jgi:hypothetical protein
MGTLEIGKASPRSCRGLQASRARQKLPDIGAREGSPPEPAGFSLFGEPTKENGPSAAGAKVICGSLPVQLFSPVFVPNPAGRRRGPSAEQNSASVPRHRAFASSQPNSLPVFRLRKCSPVQAGQIIPSYSFSRTSSSSSDQCWTFIDVAGQVKRNGTICENVTVLGCSTMM